MSFKLQRKKVASRFGVETSDGDFTLGFRKPTHPEILDIQVDVGPFQDRFYEENRRLENLREAKEQGEVDEDRPERMEISSDLVGPIYQFLLDVTVSVDGLESADGESLSWEDLTEEDQMFLISQVNLPQLLSAFETVMDTVTLEEDRKND